MSIEQMNDTSQDMQLFTFSRQPVVGGKGFGNIGSAFLIGDRNRGPRNSRGQLTAVNVGPASGWKSTINRKNGDKPIIIVGSWDKHGRYSFFYETEDRIIGSGFDQISLTPLREYQVVSIYAVVSPGRETLVLRSGAVKQRYAEPESKIEVFLLNDNINYSDSPGFDEQETLHDVNIGDTVKVTYLGSNTPQKYKCNTRIEKGKKYYDNISINLEVIR
ncbi:hypothetical protein ID850_06570 [Xenorhabdus sp. Flor]|uniref:hypothetical protein n=1 Tax=Xenorhabdus cabanillasii TaxID=351673 RepID=UPI0019A44058|nr:hypothetical protein [Xenorhabdus sp. Flor]MBD2814432.1 hypothetical protein [Xenorhabdus sp. Flor]